MIEGNVSLYNLHTRTAVILEALFLNPKMIEMPLPSEELNPQATTIDISEVIYPTLAQVESMPKTKEVYIDKQLLAETVKRDTVYQIYGYLFYTRRSLLKSLEWLLTVQTMEELLPADFYILPLPHRYQM